MPIYAIGDIHGHLDLLERQHDLIAADQARHGAGTVVHLGDLVDRGANSAGVVEWLRKGQAEGRPWVVLKGNHDRMFALFLTDPRAQDEGLRSDLSWLHPRLGGAATLASYGVRNPGDRPVARVHAEAVAAVPPAHRAWIAGLPVMHRTGDLCFVHAGVRRGVPLDAQAETDLVWIRGTFLTNRDPHDALIVHGHTAIDEATHYGNRVNLDSGAAYGGPLTTAVFDGGEVWRLTPGGRVPILRA